MIWTIANQANNIVENSLKSEKNVEGTNNQHVYDERGNELTYRDDNMRKRERKQNNNNNK